MTYDPKQKDALLQELNSPQRVLVRCDEHEYYGSTHMPPTPGCKMCWFTYYLVLFANTPPHLREQRLGELKAVVYSLAKDIDQGKADFHLYNQPIVKYQKGKE